jgi:hypothetical protein
LKPDSLEQRIEALELALKREREISAAERLRADLLHDSVKRAYQMAADVRPSRDSATKDTE